MRGRTGTASIVAGWRLWLALMLLCGAALALSACGASVKGAVEAAIAPPAPPTARICGVDSAPPRGRSAGGRRRRPTPPGVYRYRTRGYSGVPDEAVRARSLPRITKLIATRSRRFGDLVCFRLQKRYAPDLANTETYVIRGNELFLVGLRLEALGQSREVRPTPAVLFGNGTGSRWSGRFGGATSGSYDVTALGERVYRLGGERLRVTGVRSTVSYRGKVSGAQTMTAWISPGRRLAVAERVALRERMGVSDLRLHLDRRLLSVDPSGAGR
jgi:hypothetical protein